MDYTYGWAGLLSEVDWGGLTCTAGQLNESYTYQNGGLMNSNTFTMTRQGEIEPITATQTVEFGWSSGVYMGFSI